MKVAMNLFVLIFVTLFSISCTKDEITDTEKAAPEETADVPTTLNKTVMLQLINNVRQ
jgi:hypothetical protein